MADTALQAVLVHSNRTDDHNGLEALLPVRGPSPSLPLDDMLDQFESLGFQASNVAKGICIAKKMIEKQTPSKVFTVKDGAFVEVPPEGGEEKRKVFPDIFLGMTANLLGTGCRDAVRFLVKHGVKPRVFAAAPEDSPLPLHEDERDRLSQLWSPDIAEERIKWLSQRFPDTTPSSPLCPLPFRSFLSALVVSGGGMEHDVRRLCADIEADLDLLNGGGYRVTYYGSECPPQERRKGEEYGCCSSPPPGSAYAGRFGNVEYQSDKDSLFARVMEGLVRRMEERQRSLQHAATENDTVCGWTTSPSELWCLAGVWLGELLWESLPPLEGGKKEEYRPLVDCRLEQSVLYWCAVQGVPVYCPSLADGDLMHFLLHGSSASPLSIDLVKDIHQLNKFAMQSPHSSIIVCGGGVVKHHLCNANLMRNGADLSIYINNGMEFDGSDGGAKPEEALSWGKIRIDGDYVKLYSEISLVFPLLVAKVFVAAVRERMTQGTVQKE